MIKKIYTLLFVVCMALVATAQQNPKREFRGAWIQCVNGQFIGLGTQRMQQMLTTQLNQLQACGINAIMFQVRAEGDALYRSQIEPWSRYLTAQQGVAPDVDWDPLEWMVDQCHRRGMECHAWINPFRAKTKGTTALSPMHPYMQHPERFFAYDGLILFNPALQENRTYICQVVADIVNRYDVDGLHIDDYFYPYPVAGLEIPDEAYFRANPMGYADIRDWRRHNVNLFIEQLFKTVRQVKPWVKFGVSPFGIYRNRASDPEGSDTRGLQNYDDLYADVLLWVKNGWVDYNIPQIYWEIGNAAADYDCLARWWSRNAGSRPVFIGQDVERTVKYTDLNNPQMHQMVAKYGLQRSLPGIDGSCQWYAKAVCDNLGNYATMLQQHYHSTPALQPSMPWIDDKAPAKVKKVKGVWTKDGYMLFWTAPKNRGEMQRAIQYVVYRFASGERVNLEDTRAIVAVTRDTYIRLPYTNGKTKYKYVITALDRVHNESKAVNKTIKL